MKRQQRYCACSNAKARCSSATEGIKVPFFLSGWRLQSEKEDEPCVITVNCPDKTGLGCDLCRIILFFGLTVVRIDVTKVLCELELTIERVKVSTTPDGKVMDLFFVTDTRKLLHTKTRKDDTFDHLKAIIGDANISCDIELVGPETVSSSSQEPSFVSDSIARQMFGMENPNENRVDSVAFKCPSITIDNSLSPSHTLVQIICEDHKGLLYDIMRTLKDYNIQISYGRLTKKGETECELDLFIMQEDGKKIVDPSKQSTLTARLEMELSRPLRVGLISRGPDTELLVANPIELSGKGRPLVFHDITLALKLLNKPIFSAFFLWINDHIVGLIFTEPKWRKVVVPIMFEEKVAGSNEVEKQRICMAKKD
ncbi:bifunctionaluridylyltransferase/uridylyl-removing enzyme [Striga asiatica]|uniref:ACT domain-containing protein ACR n=1 Tax=Striga asiatica TaxID=4170 RepID=A0A5A7PVZ6_STRAF|nr:bifunctionaluridylyltransferase/uridylyl-removing enzyme [Striga asiatica]